MSWPLSARGGLRGCATPRWVSCRPSWSTRADSTQASWLHTALLLHWVGAQHPLLLHSLNEQKKCSNHVWVLIPVFTALFGFSFREQGLVPPLLCGLSVHQCGHRGPCVHGRLGGQEGSQGCGARGARWTFVWFLKMICEIMHRHVAPFEGSVKLVLWGLQMRHVINLFQRSRFTQTESCLEKAQR